MSNLVAQEVDSLSMEAIEKLLIDGDLKALSPLQRVAYYKIVCQEVGLNFKTRPFDYLVLNGKMVLYINKGGTDQLRKIHSVSIKIVAREKIGDVYVVTANARDRSGREDESTGAVALGKSYGDSLANLYMKAETKAKRRVTLSIVGLGMLDESEVESISGAKKVSREVAETAQDVLPAPAKVPATETASKVVADETEKKEMNSSEITLKWDGTHAYRLDVNHDKLDEWVFPSLPSKPQFAGKKLKEINENDLLYLIESVRAFQKTKPIKSFDYAYAISHVQEFLIYFGHMPEEGRVLPLRPE